MQYATAIDVETIKLPSEISVPFAIVTRTFGRNPHEYVSDKKKKTVTHAPLHMKAPQCFLVDDFFKNQEIVNYVKKSEAWSRKMLDFLMHASSYETLPLEEIVKKIADTCEGPLMAHFIKHDLEAIWNGDRIFGTGIFPNGPFFKSSKVPKWSSLRFVCTRKAFTDPNLNAKFMKRYSHRVIDLSLESLIMAIRGDLNFRQSHMPHDDVDLVIELLDHVYTHVSKQDFWNLLKMTHDHYDSNMVSVHKPGSIQYDTDSIFHQRTLKS
jgi:hypothetical protein